MSTNRIDIHIDSLELEGVEPRHRSDIAESMRQELERLIAQDGVPRQWMDGGAVGIPRVKIAAGQAPARIGQHVARAIYRGVNQ